MLGQVLIVELEVLRDPVRVLALVIQVVLLALEEAFALGMERLGRI